VDFFPHVHHSRNLARKDNLVAFKPKLPGSPISRTALSAEPEPQGAWIQIWLRKSGGWIVKKFCVIATEEWPMMSGASSGLESNYRHDEVTREDMLSWENVDIPDSVEANVLESRLH
jgi:hypothetical protein